MPQRRLRPIVFAFAIAVSAAPACAYTTAAKSYPAATLAAPPVAGDISDTNWASAPTFTGLETITTHAPARFVTTARIAFDARTLYVTIDCAQAGLPIVATQSTNNVGFGLDDFAGVGIDTSGNGTNVYYFETTPAAVRYQQASESTRYVPSWSASARRRNGGWTASLAIPLTVMRRQSLPVQRWRFNIVRHLAAINENDSLAFDPLMSDSNNNGGWPVFSDSRYWPTLEGVQVGGLAARPRPRAEVYALGVAGHDRHVFEQASGAFEPQGSRTFGADFNVPITGTIAFVGALAPDFSNVEIDQQTISPQEFRRNLAEYRPFFAQGASFFTPAFQNGINSAPNSIFYTPGIGAFVRGTKVEGTHGLDSFGALNVKGAGFDDSAIGFVHALPNRSLLYSFDAVSAHHEAYNDTAFDGVANDLTYDATVSGRNRATGFVYGLDYGGERNGAVPGATPRLAYKTEDFVDVHQHNYEVFLEYRDIGPLWNPVDGFTNVADVHGPGAFFDTFGNPKHGPIKRIEAFLFADRLMDRSGAAHQTDVNLNVDIVFHNQIHIAGGPSTSNLRLYQDGVSNNGFTSNYAGGVTVPFDTHTIVVGYRDGTPTPLDFNYTFGPFETSFSDGTARPTYLRQYDFSSARPLGHGLDLTLEYAGTLENVATGNAGERVRDGQQLRRIGLGRTLGSDSNASISLRSISGFGGFALPGVNLAGSFHRRFRNDSELFINYGTPAATSTLQRVAVKYLLRLGSGAGT